MMTQISFLIMGILAVFLALTMITRKRPITASLLLIVLMMLLAGMYGLLGAHFAAVSQVIVYAGAIMVVFVFVIMLLNVPSSQLPYGRLTLTELMLTCVGAVVALFLGTKIGQGYLTSGFMGFSRHVRAPYYPAIMNENVKNVAAALFTDYLWPFELVSFLILVSIIGAVVIAKKVKKEDLYESNPS